MADNTNYSEIVSTVQRESDFDFVQKLASFINNREFEAGYKEFAKGSTSTKNAFIWSALSAIGQDVSETLYENVIHYIDNVSNIDTCNIKSLRSMLKLVGVKYNLFDNIELLPIELQKMIDVLSISPKYLFKDGFLKTALLSQSFLDIDLSSLMDSTSADQDLSASAKYKLTTACGTDAYENKVEKLYENMLNAALNLRVDDTLSLSLSTDSSPSSITTQQSDPIWKQNIDEFTQLQYDFSALDENADEYRAYKLQHDLPSDFNPYDIVDDIQNGKDSLDNYQGYELSLLNIEIQNRDSRYQSTDSKTSYWKYKKAKVREYFELVLYKYKSISCNPGNYWLDNDYIVVDGSERNSLSNELIMTLEDGSQIISPQLVSQTASKLARLTIIAQHLREKLKIQSQKYYMKGTYNLLKYVINEYLINISHNAEYSNLSVDDGIKQIQNQLSDITMDDIAIVEYNDQTEYFNISADGDTSTSNVNSRYWTDQNIVQANPALSGSQIDNFYKKTLHLDNIEDFRFSSMSSIEDTRNTNSDSYDTFLDALFQAGANSTHVSGDEIVVAGEGEVSAANLQMMMSYGGNSFAYCPYVNYKNQTHPSYQLHPCLKDFMEYSRIEYAIKNAFINDLNSKLEEQEALANISSYIGDFGETLSVAWNNSIDYSGYQTTYEDSDHQGSTKNSPVVDYDGAFYPPAIDSYIECEDLESFVDGEFYGHLGLNSRAKNIIARQLSAFKDRISDIVKLHDSISSTYDIFKYATDVYGNAYILYKTYSTANPSYIDKLNTPGSLWIRKYNHPIAFPAIAYGSLSSLAGIDMENSIPYLTASELEDFIYDFEFDRTKKSIAFAIANSNIVVDDGSNPATKSSQTKITKAIYDLFNESELADIAICEVEETVDETTSSLKLTLRSDIELETQSLGRKCLDVDSTTNVLDSAACFNGFYSKTNSIGAIFVKKYVKCKINDNGSKTYYLSLVDDLNAKTFEYGANEYEYEVQILPDDKSKTYTLSIDNLPYGYANADVRSSYYDGTYTFAFLVEPPASIENIFGNKIDDCIGFADDLSTTYDILENSIAFIDSKCNIEDGKVENDVVEAKTYNIHVDASYLPVYEGECLNIADNSYYSNNDYCCNYSFEFLGYRSYGEKVKDLSKMLFCYTIGLIPPNSTYDASPISVAISKNEYGNYDFNLKSQSIDNVNCNLILSSGQYTSCTVSAGLLNVADGLSSAMTYKVFNVSDDKPKLLICKMKRTNRITWTKHIPTYLSVIPYGMNIDLTQSESYITQDGKIGFDVDVEMSATNELKKFSYVLEYDHLSLGYISCTDSTISVDDNTSAGQLSISYDGDSISVDQLDTAFYFKTSADAESIASYQCMFYTTWPDGVDRYNQNVVSSLTGMAVVKLEKDIANYLRLETDTISDLVLTELSTGSADENNKYEWIKINKG